MENVEGEVQRADSTYANFTGWWISPLFDWSDADLDAYHEKHDLPTNPVSLHRSADCQCLSFGHRSEELVEIQAEYPEMYEYLTAIETRVQEYRGRLQWVRDTYPDIALDLDRRRANSRPKPYHLTILKKVYPEIYNEVTNLPTEDAITRGRTDPTNYIGHGGLSSAELRAKVASADTAQDTLCSSCADQTTCRTSEVIRTVEQATDEVDTITTEQQHISQYA